MLPFQCQAVSVAPGVTALFFDSFIEKEFDDDDD